MPTSTPATERPQAIVMAAFRRRVADWQCALCDIKGEELSEETKRRKRRPRRLRFLLPLSRCFAQRLQAADVKLTTKAQPRRRRQRYCRDDLIVFPTKKAAAGEPGSYESSCRAHGRDAGKILRWVDA